MQRCSTRTNRQSDLPHFSAEYFTNSHQFRGSAAKRRPEVRRQGVPIHILLVKTPQMIWFCFALPKSVPQNVNFAIQPSMVINFLEVKDVTPKIDTPKAQRSLSEVCEIAKKFTVRVYCQGVPPKATESAGPLALSPSDVADFGK
jgi:hypothetical protein